MSLGYASVTSILVRGYIYNIVIVIYSAEVHARASGVGGILEAAGPT
jgi:hypothetical protein